MAKVSDGKLTDFRPDPDNANVGTERGQAMIEDSIREDGAARSIVVDADNVIVAGNKTHQSAVDAGLDKAVVVEVQGDELVVVKRTDFDLNGDDGRARRYAYRDNRSGEINLDWDAGQLLADLEAGVDLSDMFTDFELKDILGDALAEVETGEAPEPRIDKGAELAEKYGVQAGQVWQLGEHRLACIDSTDADAVASLMQEKKAKLFATDPPYGANAGNIGYTAQRDDIEAITKDDLVGIEMQVFLERTFSAWIPHLENNCAWYLWHPMLTQGYFAAAAAAAADLIISRQIIWKKEQFIFGRGDYHWRHELCFYGWRKGQHPPFYGERNQDTIWEIPYDIKRSEVGHPTAKPVELFAIPMRNHLHGGEICAEPFCGSGSQLLAAEHLGVQCYAADIEPKWVALAIQRWVDLTGLEPKLLQ